jgi:hypothetical protein
MIGETATLITELLLKDQLSGGVATAESKLGGLNTTVGKTGAATSIASSGLSKVESAAKKVGGAMSHAASQVSGLISNIGLFGGASAALAGAGFLEQGISLAEQDATALENLKAVSNDTTDQLSGLLAVTNKYGISASSLTGIVDKTEKNVGKLSMTTATATKTMASAALQSLQTQKLQLQEAGAKTTLIDKLISEQKARDALTTAQTAGVAPANKLVELGKQYGVTLTDSKGKALGFTDLLLNVADAYSKNTDKAQAAALAAAVFTKGYAPLIPILELGRKGYEDATAQAAAFGLTISDKNVKDLAAFKSASEDAHQALSGLELQLGLAIMPDLSTAMEAFAATVKTNLPEIESGFHDVLNFAEQVGGAITTVVIPAVQMIGGVWNGLPGPIRELLIGGFLANKAVKWTFGIDVAGLATKALGSAVAGLIGNIFKNAATGEMNVAAGVVNVGGAGALAAGGVGTAEGVAEGTAAGGILSMLKTGLVVGIAAASIAALAYETGQFMNQVGKSQGDLQKQVDTTKTQTASQAVANLSATVGALSKMGTIDRIIALTAGGGQITQDFIQAAQNVGAGASGMTAGQAQAAAGAVSQALKMAKFENLTAAIGPLTDALTKLTAAENQPSKLSDYPQTAGPLMPTVPRGDYAVRPVTNTLSGQITGAMGGIVGTLQASQAGAMVAAFTSSTSPSLNSMTAATNQLKVLQERYLAQGDTKLAAAIGADLTALGTRVDAVGTAIKLKQFTAVDSGGTGGNVGQDQYPTSPKPKPKAPDPSYEGPHASGILGMALGRTALGIAGEAGNEAVAILRNPRPIQADTGPSRVNVNLTVSARQNQTANTFQTRWGPTPVTQGAQ